MDSVSWTPQIQRFSWKLHTETNYCRALFPVSLFFTVSKGHNNSRRSREKEPQPPRRKSVQKNFGNGRTRTLTWTWYWKGAACISNHILSSLLSWNGLPDCEHVWPCQCEKTVSFHTTFVDMISTPVRICSSLSLQLATGQKMLWWRL